MTCLDKLYDIDIRYNIVTYLLLVIISYYQSVSDAALSAQLDHHCAQVHLSAHHVLQALHHSASMSSLQLCKQPSTLPSFLRKLLELQFYSCHDLISNAKKRIYVPLEWSDSLFRIFGSIFLVGNFSPRTLDCAVQSYFAAITNQNLRFFKISVKLFFDMELQDGLCDVGDECCSFGKVVSWNQSGQIHIECPGQEVHVKSELPVEFLRVELIKVNLQARGRQDLLNAIGVVEDAIDLVEILVLEDLNEVQSSIDQPDLTLTVARSHHLHSLLLHVYLPDAQLLFAEKLELLVGVVLVPCVSLAGLPRHRPHPPGRMIPAVLLERASGLRFLQYDAVSLQMRFMSLSFEAHNFNNRLYQLLWTSSCCPHSSTGSRNYRPSPAPTPSFLVYSPKYQIIVSTRKNWSEGLSSNRFPSGSRVVRPSTSSIVLKNKTPFQGVKSRCIDS